ncbi:antitoxin Xre-like helix-turn-helix domain-containing protein [Streptomyces fuscichromogenes]|uniref:antitoxin Xre-like helix-turn-helix domain-containing protein n=1 Tax=Streptomyces fuscichromogenes TaxID=1324013 RepID=UPI0037FF6B5C
MTVAMPPASEAGVGVFEPEPGTARTDVQITHVANPVVRDTLIKFEASLSPVNPPVPVPSSRSSWPLDAVVIALIHELPAALAQSTGGAAWLVHGATQSADSGSPLPSAEARLHVNAVAEIREILGFTQQQVLQASGVSKRTFQNWRKGSTRRIRPSSVGRLWELHALACDLSELNGPAWVRHWFAADPQRSKMLRLGKFDDLMAAASLSRAQRHAPPLLFGAAEIEERADLNVTPLRGAVLNAEEIVEPPE